MRIRGIYASLTVLSRVLRLIGEDQPDLRTDGIFAIDSTTFEGTSTGKHIPLIYQQPGCLHQECWTAHSNQNMLRKNEHDIFGPWNLQLRCSWGIAFW
jgi:hypothetical protein